MIFPGADSNPLKADSNQSKTQRGGKSLCFIPVFNQMREFPRVLDELRSTPLPVDQILFVNNGSSDGSENLVHRSGYPFIDVPKNRGIGYSFMLATDWAFAQGFDIFAVMASNGKMLPQELQRVVLPVQQGEADYVTGSRYLTGGASPNLPAFRQYTIPLVTLAVKLLTRQTLTDATCGFKAYRLDLLRHARFDWKARWLETYGFEYYFYCKVLLEKNLRWWEVPITMRYPEKGQAYTKMKPFVSWWQMLKPWMVGLVDGKGFSQELFQRVAPEVEA